MVRIPQPIPLYRRIAFIPKPSLALSGLITIVRIYLPSTCCPRPLSPSYLSSVTAILFLIGTNSVRCNSAADIISHIQVIINYIRTHQPHLSSKHSINIVPCFPCLKPSYTCNTSQSLSNNIHQYNSLLSTLADTLHFTIVNFNVMDYHLGPDRMHLHFQYKNLIPNSINDYFAYLSSILSTLPFQTTTRSAETKARRNHRRHLQLTLKQQQQYVLKRSVSSS